jgi:hypothetical protein
VYIGREYAVVTPRNGVMLGWLIVASYRFNEVLISALFASVRPFV